MLKNRFYVGEVPFKGEILQGSQPPLMERALFDAVQAKLAVQRTHSTTTRLKSQALLSVLLFDDVGQRMVTTHATKNRVRYRYYVSARCLRGPVDQPVGTIRRVAAQDIELAITKALLAEKHKGRSASSAATLTREMLESLVARVEVRLSQLAIRFKTESSEQGTQDHSAEELARLLLIERLLVVPWKKASIARDVLGSAIGSDIRIKPIKIGPRVALIRSIALCWQWLEKIVIGSATIAVSLTSTAAA